MYTAPWCLSRSRGDGKQVVPQRAYHTSPPGQLRLPYHATRKKDGAEQCGREVGADQKKIGPEVAGASKFA